MGLNGSAGRVTTPLCRHCKGRAQAARGPAKCFGLCCRCYSCPAVRASRNLPGPPQWTQPKSITAKDFEPTDAMPGTKEKVRVMAERASKGLPLYHPLDACEVDDHFVTKEGENGSAQEA